MRYILFILLIACNSDRETATTIKVDTAFDSLTVASDSLNTKLLELDSLTSSVYKQTYAQLKEYKEQVAQYESQEKDIIIKKVVDSSALKALRAKLTSANNEIARLKGELRTISGRKSVPRNEVMSYIQQPIETPDENSIVITLDGSVPQGLSIYLIPYNRKIKKLITYDASCENWIINNRSAEYYKGVYFFNDVNPGKYIIKICTYMGNYKTINKGEGKLSLSMEVAPPIQ